MATDMNIVRSRSLFIKLLSQSETFAYINSEHAKLKKKMDLLHNVVKNQPRQTLTLSLTICQDAEKLIKGVEIKLCFLIEILNEILIYLKDNYDKKQ